MGFTDLSVRLLSGKVLQLHIMAMNLFLPQSIKFGINYPTELIIFY